MRLTEYLKRKPPVSIICLLIIGSVLAASFLWNGRGNKGHVLEEIPQGVSGYFKFSAYDENANTNGNPTVHYTSFVNGVDFSGMEDNDIRGFLDGRFKNGWNQPGQSHVRVGRREDSSIRAFISAVMNILTRVPGLSTILAPIEPSYPYLGEHELFRVLCRFDKLQMPPNVSVIDATLEWTVEKAPPFDLQLVLYEVKKDWNPGKGGTLSDNTSPPNKGEVWWNDSAYLENKWGLPGVGFASEDHQDADTPIFPLAIANFRPGNKHIQFSSESLNIYLSDRINKKKPLLFLIKLSDYLEDTPNSRIALFSANHGEDYNVLRRPKLKIKWSSNKEVKAFQKEVTLEYGRTYYTGRIYTEARNIAVSFKPVSGFEKPTIEMRGWDGNKISNWQHVEYPASLGFEWMEFKLHAVTNPVVLGQAFISSIRDTWIVSKPPEEQSVEWEFVSPSGKKVKQLAKYMDDFEWTIEFIPNELGRWSYSWNTSFTKKPYISEQGYFDAVIGDDKNIREQLRLLKERIAVAGLKTHYERMKEFEIEFSRLERAFMQSQTPEIFGSVRGEAVLRELDEVRELLWGKPIRPVLKAFKREY